LVDAARLRRAATAGLSRRLRTRRGTALRMVARKPVHVGSGSLRGASGIRRGSACTGSRRHTRRSVWLFRRRERERLERNGHGVAVVPVPDDRGAAPEADEPGPSISVHHGLVRSIRGHGAELHLQEPRAGDRVQSERVEVGRVHADRVRQRRRSSFRPHSCRRPLMSGGQGRILTRVCGDARPRRLRPPDDRGIGGAPGILRGRFSAASSRAVAALPWP
jgi:hypothetical protein